MKIGIMGGSIAGCFATILLRKEGHEVTVFERSKKELVGRGGGVGAIISLMKQLQEERILEEDFPCFEISKMSFIFHLLKVRPDFIIQPPSYSDMALILSIFRDLSHPPGTFSFKIKPKLVLTKIVSIFIQQDAMLGTHKV